MCEHSWKDSGNEYRFKRECIICGISISSNTPLGDQRRQQYVNKIVEFLKTEEGQKQYKGPRLEKYVKELEGIINA